MSQHSLKRFGFTLIELLVVISIIALLLGILVPVLGIAKKNANIMKEGVNIRNIDLALNTYGGTNKDWFAGLTSAGKYAFVTAGALGAQGEYYAARTAMSDVIGTNNGTDSANNTALAILLEEGQVAPAQLQSPGENGANSTAVPVAFSAVSPDTITGTKAVGTAGAAGTVESQHSSYALLQYAVPALKSEWKAIQTQQAVIAGARLVFTDGGSITTNQFSSLWTDAKSGKYKGAIAHGDNSTNTETFSNADVISTSSPYFANLKYGSTVFSATASSTTALGVFGKSPGPATSGSANYGNVGTKGQLGSAID